MNTSTHFQPKIPFTRLYLLIMCVLTLHFFLNYFASPFVEYSYVILTILIALGVALFDYKDSLALIFIHFYIEGQGRIVFGYNPLARIMFDLIVLIFVGQYVVRQKKLFPGKEFPTILRLLILGHFMVFFLSLFNVKGAGFFINLPMIKVYILPFLVFFVLLDSPIDFNSKEFRRVVFVISVMIIMNGLLSVRQFMENSPMMLSISPHYGDIGKLRYFTKLTFRPFGTSFVPGGISSYLPLTLGLFFLCTPPIVAFILSFAASFVMLILCQVRTAMIQYAIMFAQFLFIYFRYTKMELKKVFSFLVILIAFGMASQALYMGLVQNIDKRLVDLTMNRFTSIFDSQTFEKSRLGINDILRVIVDKVSENPFGLGPGRTHPVTESMGLAIDNDPVYNLDYSWNFDNLWASIAMEFGIGGIFYAGTILLMPIYLFSMAVSTYRRKKIIHFKTITISFITIFIIVLANWGGVGIPFNPISFMFWYWCAIGFHAYRMSLAEDGLSFYDGLVKSK